jgi:hypothetical protein
VVISAIEGSAEAAVAGVVPGVGKKHTFAGLDFQTPKVAAIACTCNKRTEP